MARESFCHARFPDQEVKVLGHYYIASDNEVIFGSYLLQNVQKEIAATH